MSAQSNFFVPLWLAVVMNVNVIIGSGIFINAGGLAQYAGPWGFMSYLLVALLFLPLVLSIAQLSKSSQALEGGLYHYSKLHLGRRAGIVCGLSYCVAQTATIAALVYAFAVYARSLVPALQVVPFVGLCAALLSALTLLNIFGARFGGVLQMCLVFFKLFPLFFVILFGLSYFRPDVLVLHAPLPKFWSSLSLAMYALMGFEMCTSIGHVIEDGERNLSRVLVTSFMIVAGLYVAYQLMLYAVLGDALSGSIDPFGQLAHIFVARWPVVGGMLCNILCPLLNLAVTFSIFGSSYGKIFGNIWNIYAVGMEGLPAYAQAWFVAKNRFGIPVVALGLQWLGSLVLLLPHFELVTLQRCAVIGVVVVYTISLIAIEYMYQNKRYQPTLSRMVVHLGFIPCLLIGYNCLKDLLF